MELVEQRSDAFHKSYGINDYLNKGANVLSKRADVNKNRVYFIKASF